jgi:hypothetical protein
MTEYFCDEETKLRLKRCIHENGFQTDPFLKRKSLQKVYGINLAICWPLPSPIAQRYKKMSRDLRKIESGIYIYPYHSTHITVATLVNFKEHIEPTDRTIADMQQTADYVIRHMQPLFSQIRPFRISVGPPVLSNNAAFLPVLNPTGEIAQVRLSLAGLPQTLLPELNIPKIIHSTFMRFKRPPKDTAKFLSDFENISEGWEPCTAEVSEFVLTSETGPYMISGGILHKFILK